MPTISEKLQPLFVRSLFHLTNREFMKARNKQPSDKLLQFSEKEAVLYIHFPFCDAICNYCPFSKSMNLTDAHTYCKALLEELDLLKQEKRIHKTPLKALFFGGGTPSLMPMHMVGEILTKVRESFGEIPQVTMECNPESLTVEQALAYKRSGINRLSIGVQSFHQEILDELGRKSRPILIKQLISDIVSKGFTNISIDLIYGFEQQSESMLLSDIGEAISLGVEHISLFPLINHRKNNRQELTAVQFSHQRTLYLKARTYLESHGFSAYSVEDFTRTERAKNRYQEAVWSYPQNNLIILGTAGFGMVEECNYSKVTNRKKYLESIEKRELPLDELYRTPAKNLILRRILMGLHYHSITISDLERTYGLPPKRVAVALYLLRKLKLVTIEDGLVETTEEGAFVTSLLWAKIMLSRMSRN